MRKEFDKRSILSDASKSKFSIDKSYVFSSGVDIGDTLNDMATPYSRTGEERKKFAFKMH